MGLAKFFKQKIKNITEPQKAITNSTNIVHTNAIRKDVITFEKRKRTAIPSARGLYPAEILLLDYCSRGAYPKPQNEYPKFWWFSYGIQDVDAMLKSLEDRGFLTLSSVKNSVKGLTVQQLKDILAANNQSITGKKSDLVNRVISTISEEKLVEMGVQPKYALTETGSHELSENEYVSYMHRTPYKTTEDDLFGTPFNVWSINKLLGTGDKSNWRTVVEKEEQKMKPNSTPDTIPSAPISINDLLSELKSINCTTYKSLDIHSQIAMQDRQIDVVHKANEKYKNDHDLDSYICFWEELWANGGLIFCGVRWHFELADLYIKAKRYDDAMNFVLRLKKINEAYVHKADIYIERITKLKTKQNHSKSNQ